MADEDAEGLNVPSMPNSKTVQLSAQPTENDACLEGGKAMTVRDPIFTINKRQDPSLRLDESTRISPEKDQETALENENVDPFIPVSLAMDDPEVSNTEAFGIQRPDAAADLWQDPILPDTSGQDDRDGTLARRKQTYEGFGLVDLSSILPGNPKEYISVWGRSENLYHLKYSVASTSTMKCGMCGANCQTLMYCCDHPACTQQICRECILNQAESPSQVIVWNGKQHNPFVEAWKVMEQMPNKTPSFDSAISFDPDNGGPRRTERVIVTDKTDGSARKKGQSKRKAITIMELVTDGNDNVTGQDTISADDKDKQPTVEDVDEAVQTLDTAAEMLSEKTQNIPNVPEASSMHPGPNRLRTASANKITSPSENLLTSTEILQGNQASARESAQTPRLSYQGQPHTSVVRLISDPADVPAAASARIIPYLTGEARRCFISLTYFRNGKNIYGRPLSHLQRQVFIFNQGQDRHSQVRIDAGDGKDQYGDPIQPNVFHGNVHFKPKFPPAEEDIGGYRQRQSASSRAAISNPTDVQTRVPAASADRAGHASHQLPRPVLRQQPSQPLPRGTIRDKNTSAPVAIIPPFLPDGVTAAIAAATARSIPVNTQNNTQQGRLGPNDVYGYNPSLAFVRRDKDAPIRIVNIPESVRVQPYMLLAYDQTNKVHLSLPVLASKTRATFRASVDTDSRVRSEHQPGTLLPLAAASLEALKPRTGVHRGHRGHGPAQQDATTETVRNSRAELFPELSLAPSTTEYERLHVLANVAEIYDQANHNEGRSLPCRAEDEIQRLTGPRPRRAVALRPPARAVPVPAPDPDTRVDGQQQASLAPERHRKVVVVEGDDETGHASDDATIEDTEEVNAQSD